MKGNFIYLLTTVSVIISLNSCNKDKTVNPEMSQTPVIKGWKMDSIDFSYSGISLNDVDFPDAGNGYMVDYNGDFLKTTDSARTWTISSIDSNKVRNCSLSFIDQNTGYVYGTWDSNNNSYGTLYKTVDGGAHWTKQRYDTAYNFYSLKFFDEMHGIALEFKFSEAFIRITENGGSSWKKVNVDLDPWEANLFYLGDICYATGKNRKILKSVDHGETWTSISTPESVINIVQAYYFLNEETGFLSLQEGCYKTTDGGKNWEKSDMPFNHFFTPYMPLQKFHFCNINDGIYIVDTISVDIGNNEISPDHSSFFGRYFYTTTDGGKNWTKSDLFPYVPFRMVIYTSDNFAYCINDKKIYTLRKL